MYLKDKKRKDLILKGTEAQNVEDILPFVAHLIKDSCIKPLLRYSLVFDNIRESIFEIDKVLSKERKMSNYQDSQPLIPFIFHYDTTFNVGDYHVSILSMRDPTKRRIAESAKSMFNEAILPVGVMIHEGRLQEQHEAFFRAIDAQFLKGKSGDLSKSRPFLLVTDHEFKDIWPSAKTFFCSNHMQSNMKQILQKKGLNSHEDRNIIKSVFYKLLNAKSKEAFELIVEKLKDDCLKKGAWTDIQKYLLKNIVPKIRDYSGR